MTQRERHSRQSFLGENSERIIGDAFVGIVGLGGGGSHIAQQLAHIGFTSFFIADPDFLEESNMNRMVGARFDDIQKKKAKAIIIERAIKDIQPEASVERLIAKWQGSPEHLKGCDVIFGCVDSFKERRELEVFCRRFLIPYIDIGMDVSMVPGDFPRMAGQVILSMPDGPCMWCLKFLNDEKLTLEVSQYGKAGPRPQVIWPNGILASSAVGMAMNILTGWTGKSELPVYLSYDGNLGLLQVHPRVQSADFDPNHCPHFPGDKVGEPVLRAL